MREKVLFVIESLGGGGAEKVLSTMMHHIDKNQYDVSVLAICGGGRYESEVAANVNYDCLLNHSDRYKGIMKLYYVLKYKLIYSWLPIELVYRLFVPKGFDVEVAFVEGFATKLLAASNNKRAKRIAWVHVDLVYRPWTLDSGIFDSLEEERIAYQKYDRVVCVSKSVEKVMRGTYGVTSTVSIYNPVDVPLIRELGNEHSLFSVDRMRYNIVSVGRLAREKGYDRLLPIIRNVRKVYPNVHLWLIGAGADEQVLKTQADDLGISDCVTFTGFMKNPYALMSKMDLFVCSSRAEGFSLALAESMVLGVPVVSMNCSGPNELIDNNKYGVLCDTYDDLEKAIQNAIEGKVVPMGIPSLVDINETMRRVSELFV